MKRNHSWAGHQCVRCGLDYRHPTGEVRFPASGYPGVWVPLLGRKLPRCGENESQWRARLALKKPAPRAMEERNG